MNQTLEKIRVLIAEDHEVVCIGLRSLFDPQPDIELIRETPTIKETLISVIEHNPDVILLNSKLDDGSGIEQIPKLIASSPNSKVLLYSATENKDKHLKALRLGASGIFTKKQKTNLLCKAIRSIHQGELWFNRSLMVTASTLPSDNYSLTRRENTIACLSSKGLSAKAISEKLFISEKTVRNHLTSIFSKLEVKSQLELCIKASSIDFCKKHPPQKKPR